MAPFAMKVFATVKIQMSTEKKGFGNDICSAGPHIPIILIQKSSGQTSEINLARLNDLLLVGFELHNP